MTKTEYIARTHIRAATERHGARPCRQHQEERMAKGYVIARGIVTDGDKWAQYAAKASEAMKIYGGTPIVRGGRCEVAEGEGRARNVVIEFESFDKARAYANSPEYADARKLRIGAGVLDIVVVEGQ
jgi:uncharacterized protein (DUF1330 family)